MIGLSLDDLRNLPAALATMERVEHKIKEESGYDPSPVERVIQAAARAFSRLVSVCTTCEGSGSVPLVDPNGEPNPKFCPDCVDGLVVSPEAVAKFKARIIRTGGNLASDTIEAGLRAALGGEG